MKPKRLLASAMFGLTVLCLLPPAGAAATEFAAGGYPAAITGAGEGSHVFSFDEGKVSVTCSTASFSGEISKVTSELSLSPTYSSCTMNGLAVSVSNNGCTYKIHSGEEVSENKLKGKLDLACPAEKVLVLKSALTECEVQIAAQSGLSSVEYEDKPEPEPAKILMSMPVSGIKYNKTKDAGFLCPLNGTGTKTDGKYSGKTSMVASHGEETTALQDGTISITVPSEVKFGAVNEEKSFLISNSGSTQWRIGFPVVLAGTGKFKPTELCLDKDTKGGFSCKEEVVCEAPGVNDLKINFTYGVVLVTLRC